MAIFQNKTATVAPEKWKPYPPAVSFFREIRRENYKNAMV